MYTELTQRRGAVVHNCGVLRIFCPSPHLCANMCVHGVLRYQRMLDNPGFLYSSIRVCRHCYCRFTGTKLVSRARALKHVRHAVVVCVSFVVTLVRMAAST